MTIVVDSDETSARRVEAHLYKLVNVLQVENLTHRAGNLARPGADQGRGAPAKRAAGVQLVDVFRARNRRRRRPSR